MRNKIGVRTLFFHGFYLDMTKALGVSNKKNRGYFKCDSCAFIKKTILGDYEKNYRLSH